MEHARAVAVRLGYVVLKTGASRVLSALRPGAFARAVAFLLCVGAFSAAGGLPAFAKDAPPDVKPEPPRAALVSVMPGVTPFETAAKQACLIDTATGAVLYARDADQSMPTSSMSKLMTMYLVFDAIKSGRLSLNDTLTASHHAWSQEGSRMFLREGQSARVEDLIRGVVVQSGNDAAVVFAEGLGGTERNFAAMMNAKAKELGMLHSHFVNATGLPDPDHYSTARDLAVLAVALLRDFPEDYHYFSELEFTYNGIKQGNRNPLLWRKIDVDGLKTGHTEVGGYGLVASALRGGRRLVLVINGTDGMQSRADESARLLDWGYREYGLYPVVKAGDVFAKASVWLGQAPDVALAAAQDAVLTLPRPSRQEMKAVVDFAQPMAAPVVKGQALGKLTITAPGIEPREIPLIAASDVPRLGFWARLAAKARFLLHRQ